jgi:hypothetical protein
MKMGQSDFVRMSQHWPQWAVIAWNKEQGCVEHLTCSSVQNARERSSISERSLPALLCIHTRGAYGGVSCEPMQSALPSLSL